MDELTRAMVEAGLMAPPATAAPKTQEVTDDMLADLLSVEEHLASIEASSEVIADADLDAVVTQLEVEENKAALYEKQESVVEMRDATAPVTPTVEPEVKKVTAKRAASTGAGTGTPRTSRVAGTDVGSYFSTLSGSDELRDVVNALPKKVQDKAANLADHLYKAHKLSVYTQAAVRVLKTDGALTNLKLVEVLMKDCQKRNATEGYSIGTARSQAQQAITLLNKLGIAKLDSRTLKPVSENSMWQALESAA